MLQCGAEPVRDDSTVGASVVDIAGGHVEAPEQAGFGVGRGMCLVAMDRRL
jgi:hypothetical protein